MFQRGRGGAGKVHMGMDKVQMGRMVGPWAMVGRGKHIEAYKLLGAVSPSPNSNDTRRRETAGWRRASLCRRTQSPLFAGIGARGLRRPT